jgi:hypothetical protein
MIMTQDKARKAATRQRMAETGEPYSVARHAVEREHEGAAAEDPLSADRGAPPRDDRWYASEAEEAGITVAELRVQHLADLADKARERADLADETGDSPHTRPHRSYRDRDHDGADPGRSHHPRGPADRLQDRLGKFMGRLELLMSRAGQATNPAHDEPKDTDSD